MSSFKKRSPFPKKLGELVEPVTREALKKRGVKFEFLLVVLAVTVC